MGMATVGFRASAGAPRQAVPVYRRRRGTGTGCCQGHSWGLQELQSAVTGHGQTPRVGRTDCNRWMEGEGELERWGDGGW